MSENAFYLVTNPTLFSVALAEAAHLARLWDVDVHVFLEDQKEPAPDAGGTTDRVFVHVNELAPHLPSKMPENETLPWVVFLRIAGPKVLSRYRRLIYIDTDVHGLRREDALWDIDLENGLGAVSDQAFLIWSDLDASKMRERVAPRGLRGARYFNSGVLVIDTAKWNADGLMAGLRGYFDRFAKVANFLDQDYLNHVLENDWTELSPAINLTMAAVDLGLGQAWPPVFLHVTGAYKPWSPYDANYEGPMHARLRQIYTDLLSEVRHPLPSTRKYHASLEKDIKSGVRRGLAVLGWQSRKEKRQRRDATTQARQLHDYFLERAEAGAFADVARGEAPGPFTPPQFVFNGHLLRIAGPQLL